MITLNANADPDAASALVQAITYENTDTDNPTTGDRTVRYVLTDGDGGTSANYDTTISVARVNDVPTIINLDGDNLNYDEGDGAVVIEEGGNAIVSDVDSTDFDTGTLTVTISAGGDNAGDVISIRNQGTGAGQVGVSGSDVTFGGTVVGTFTGGSGGTPLTVTWNADSTPLAVTQVVQNITYENTDVLTSTGGTRTVDFVVTDGDGGTSLTHSATVNVNSVNNAPTIVNLDGDTLAYNEGDGQQAIEQAGDAVVADVDSLNFDTGTLTVSFTAGSDSAEDVLSVLNLGTGSGQIGVSGSNVSYEGTTIGTFTGGTSGSDLVITLNANADATATAALVEAVSYENTDTDNPTTGDRTVRYVLTDGDGATSANYDTTVSVAAVNDAPVLNDTGTPALPSITEDDVDNAGMTVADLLATGAGGDPITDVDGDPEGIAITVRNNGRGIWEYSINGGTNWDSVGTVSEMSALLLRATDLVRFNPNGENAPITNPTFEFRAWDQTSGTEGTKVDASTNGGTTAFSTASETASITVTDANDAPVLNNSGTVTLDAQAEDAGAPAGVVGTVITDLVSIGGNVSDVDASSQTGIAITTADVNEGTWWYTTDNGTNWNLLGDVSDSSARVLNANSNTRIYLQSETDFNGTVTDAITFRSWDRSVGANGSLQDTSTNGGTTAYSSATETADITITAVNDRPQLAGPSIVTNGTFDTNLSGWTATGNVDHDGTQARFGQIGGMNGTLSQTLTTEIGKTYVVRFDYGDFSTTASQSLDVELIGNSTLVDTSLTTGVVDNSFQTYQYTFIADSTSTTITFADTSADHSGVRGYLDNVSVATDAVPNAALTYTENDGAVIIDNTFNIEDIDDVNMESAVVQITANYTNGEDALAFVDQNGISGTWNAGTGTMTLTGSATIANYEMALRSITFENTSNDPSTATRTISFQVDDGNDSSNTQTRDIIMVAVNDAPTATNNTISTNEDTDYTFTAVDFNFNDIDGDSLTSIQITSLESVGELQLNRVDVTLNQIISRADIDAGNLKFVPITNQNGNGYDSFSFSVNDGFTDSVTSYSITVDVTAVIDIPTTTTVTLNPIAEDSGARIITQPQLLANANHPDGSGLTATNLVINSGNGTLINSAALSWTYIPALNDDTAVSFDYIVTDGTSTVAAIANLDITPVNDPPIVANDNASLEKGDSVDINLISNDSDLDSTLDLDSIVIVTPPSHGYLVDYGDGIFGYFHNGSSNNTDSFTYTINDVDGAKSNITSVNIVIEDDKVIIPEPNNPSPEEPNKPGDPDDEELVTDKPVKDPTPLEDPNIAVINVQLEKPNPNVSITTILNDLSPKLLETNNNLNSVVDFEEEEKKSVDQLIRKDLKTKSLKQKVEIKTQDFNSQIPAFTIDPGLALELKQIESEISQAAEQKERERLVFERSIEVGGVVIFAGILKWLLHASSLLASLLGALPAWSWVDPIPVLSSKKNDDVKKTGKENRKWTKTITSILNRFKFWKKDVSSQ
ncbi:MAG: beta strand repeat-containing protein [Gammaproteobacteria bacterium]